MAGSEATDTILKDLRVRLAELLSQPTTRDRFREKVTAWCSRLVKTERPGAFPADAGTATRFGSLGSLAMIACLMKQGPQDIDEAYVLLGAIHDSGPHIGRTGQASPVKWDTKAQSVSGKDDPLIPDWAAHAEWHMVVSQLDTLTPEAVGRLPAWYERVEGDIKTMESDVSSKGGGAPDGPLARVFASIREPRRLSGDGYDVHAADDEWETYMKQVSAEVEDTARHALQTLKEEMLPRSDGQMFLPASFAVWVLEPCLRIVVRCRLESMDIEPDTANFGVRLADALNCRKWDLTISPTPGSDCRAIAEAIAFAYMQAKEPPVIDWMNVRAVLERWIKNLEKVSPGRGVDLPQRPVCADGTDSPSSCGLAAQESVNGPDGKDEPAEVDAAWGKMCNRTNGARHADDTPSNAENNTFERKGHVWCIRLEGTELLFKDTHGFRYIAEILLKKAGIGASDLRSSIAKGVTAKYSRDVTRGFVNGDAAGNEANTGVQSGLGDESRQTMVDEEHIKEQVKSQVEDIARAQRDNDPAAEEIARKELHRLTEHLASVTGRGGKMRAIDDRAENDRKAVSSAIEGALKKMAGTDRKLGEHFRKHLRSGRVFSYTGSAAWKVVL